MDRSFSKNFSNQHSQTDKVDFVLFFSSESCKYSFIFIFKHKKDIWIRKKEKTNVIGNNMYEYSIVDVGQKYVEQSSWYFKQHLLTNKQKAQQKRKPNALT